MAPTFVPDPPVVPDPPESGVSVDVGSGAADGAVGWGSAGVEVMSSPAKNHQYR